MTDTSIYTNSLRLVRLFGGNSGGSGPSTDTSIWFYNGSIKFEADPTKPHVFATVTEAAQYFTDNTKPADRSPGQFVTFALIDSTNWVLYVYTGPDITDENYANVNNWKQFGDGTSETQTEIYEVLQAIK